MEKRDLIRTWLRSKNIHIADIKEALEWYDTEITEGRTPTDHEVLNKAEESHKQAVAVATPVKTVIEEKVVDHYVPIPFINMDKIRIDIVVCSGIGTGVALAVYSLIEWVF